MVENSQYGLTWFRIRFGLLQCKAYTKGQHVLRFEATVHNTRELRCRRRIDNFPEIIGRPAGITGRFATALDCADIAFIADGFLDDLPLPSTAATPPGRPPRTCLASRQGPGRQARQDPHRQHFVDRRSASS